MPSIAMVALEQLLDAVQSFVLAEPKELDLLLSSHLVITI